MYFACEKNMNLGDPEVECYEHSPPNSYVEAPTLSVILFGDGDTKEIFKVKQGYRVGS